MDLESAISEVVALLGEGDERLLGVEAAVAVGVIGGGIGLETLAIATEELRHRGTELLAGEIPERDVERPMAHVVELTDLTLEVVVDGFSFVGVPADEARGQHQRLRQCCLVPAPERYVFASGAVLGADHHGIFRHGEPAARHVADVADRARARGLDAHVLGVESEFVDFDQVNDTHGELRK